MTKLIGNLKLLIIKPFKKKPIAAVFNDKKGLQNVDSE